MTGGGSEPPAPPVEIALQAFARALEVGDQRGLGQLRSEHPSLDGQFDALESAWKRLAPHLGRSPVSPARQASVDAGGDVDPGISLDRRPGSAHSDAGPQAGPLLDRIASRSVPPERYSARREIARGGMGSIQSVWDDDLRRHLVMKVMMRPQDRNPEAVSRPPDSRQVSRFLEEAQITSQLDHPSIVPVHDIGIDEQSRLYFTMPLVQGEDLGQVIRKARAGEDGWNRTRVLSAMVKVMEAVAFAHSRGVIHRDLKPENIMVGRFGETYVMDWGLARVLDEAQRTELTRGRTTLDVIRDRVKRGAEKKLRPLVRTERSVTSSGGSSVDTLDGDVVGTPGYMAPEQARGQRDRTGPGADIYAAGAILYHLLTGHRPFDDPISRESGSALFERILESTPVPIEQLEKDCPEELAAIVRVAMATNPAQRYESMVAMVEDLRAYLEGHVVSAYEAGLLAEVRKWIVRNRVLASTIGGAAAAVLALVIFAVWQQQRNLDDLKEEQRRTDNALLQAQAEQEEAQLQRDRAQAATQEILRAKSEMEQSRDDARSASQLAIERLAQFEQQSALLIERDRIQRRQRYMANIRAANIALAAGDMPEARRVLGACEEDLRGWEWTYLRNRIDLSLATIDTNTSTPLALASTGDGGVLELAADRNLRLWRGGQSAPEQRWRLDVAAPVAMDFHAEAGKVAISGGPGAVFVYGVDSKEPQRRLFDPLDLSLEFGPLAFDPTGNFLAAGVIQSGNRGQERSLAVFDVLTGRLRAPLGGRRARTLTTVKWSAPDGAWLALGYDDGNLQLIDAVEFETVAELDLHRGAITDLAFSNDGSRLVTTSIDQTATVLDVESRSTITTVRHDGGPLHHAAFAAGDRWIVTSTAGRTLLLWDARTAALRSVLNGHDGTIRDLTIDRTSDQLITTADDGTIRFWDPTTSEPSTSVDLRNVRTRGRVTFVADGSQLMVHERFGASFIDLRTLERTTSIGSGAPVSGPMHLTVDGRHLIAPSVNNLAAWSTADGSPRGLIGTIPRAWTRPWSQLTIAADGSVAAASGLSDGFGGEHPDRHLIGTWSLPDRRLRAERDDRLDADHLDAERTAVLPPGVTARELLALPGNRELLVACDDGRVRLYRRDETDPERLTLDGELVADVTLACEATGRTLRSAQWYLSSIATGSTAHELLEVRPLSIHCLALDPNAGVLAAGRDDGGIELWSLTDRTLRTTLRGHEGAIRSVEFSADGSRLLSSSADTTLRIWDAELGEALIALREHDAELVDACFAPDGSSIASIDADDTLRLWETDPPAERLQTRREAALLRRDARQALLGMLDNFVGTAELMARVSTDNSLSEPLRNKIRAFVEANGENAVSLASDAWSIVRTPNAPREEYEAALAWARFACALDPDQSIFVRTLGVAQFRNGQLEACVESLERAGALHRQGPRVEELAVLAMAYGQLGDDGRAREAHLAFDSMASTSIWQKSDLVRSFAREVRDQLGVVPLIPGDEGSSE